MLKTCTVSLFRCITMETLLRRNCTRSPGLYHRKLVCSVSGTAQTKEVLGCFDDGVFVLVSVIIWACYPIWEAVIHQARLLFLIIDAVWPLVCHPHAIFVQSPGYTALPIKSFPHHHQHDWSVISLYFHWPTFILFVCFMLLHFHQCLVFESPQSLHFHTRAAKDMIMLTAQGRDHALL